MKKHIFVWLSLIATTCYSIDNPYLKAPSKVFGQSIMYSRYALHLMQLFRLKQPLTFNWNFLGSSLHFNFNCGKAGMAITSLTVPAGYAEQFREVKCKDSKMFVYNAGTINSAQLPVPESHPTSSPDYYVAQPRKFREPQKAQHITLHELASYIKDHSIVFYTGAGISVASGVPSMAQLENALFIKHNKGILDIGNIIANASQAVATFKFFFEAAFQLPPSKAHYAVAQIANIKRCAVFTENIDVLHQKTGIKPIMPEPMLRDQGDNFKEIDAIFCIGLSHDDRGLLAFYKENNPAGIIIALDLKQPEYLGAQDLLLIGDLQEILPKLSEQFEGLKKSSHV